MALESRWVDAIHARLLVRYGTRWINLWAGIPEEAVKADWAAELHGLGGDAITHALQHLPPEFPPTVAQFKALALGRSEPPLKALSAPKPDPQVVAQIVAKAKTIGAGCIGKEWAHRLREREERGERLPAASRAMWRAALAEGDSPSERTDFEAKQRTDALKRETQRKVDEYMEAVQ